MTDPVALKYQAVGPWSVNTHVLICTRSGRSFLIDPGGEPQTLAKMLEGTRPAAILITHDHPDHIGALEQVRKRLKVPVMAHPGHGGHSAVHADRWVRHGDLLDMGEHRVRVYHTPGHTADQVCFGIEGDSRIIVGDTLFEGGPGKTWSPADFQTTLTTLRRIVLAWPDETRCYPGHGPSFRLGDKRKAIERFIDKAHGSFYGDAEWG
jgi:hydroxyacylglutathione hydrolase